MYARRYARTSTLSAARVPPYIHGFAAEKVTAMGVTQRKIFKQTKIK
jgi:capsid portal protein